MSHAKSLICLTNSLHHRLLSIRLFSTGNTTTQENRPTYRSRDVTGNEGDEEFRIYEIPGLQNKQQQRRKGPRKFIEKPPRYKKMTLNQDWTNIWPTASSFRWSTIPFPVRQGNVENSSENQGIIPGRYANLELLKIPNFLHLTPAHIKKHCNAIKKFCNQWPAGLETDEKCDEVFPIKVTTRDYCFSGPTVKDERARVVTVQMKLADLKLDYHGEDKIKRLLEDKYSPETDEITLNTNRCPLKKQNYDYAMYLLSALYYEANKTESWEDEKADSDMEKFFWDRSEMKDNLVILLQRIHAANQEQGSEETSPCLSEDELLKLPEVTSLKDTVTQLFNEGENIETINNYKQSVLNILGLKCEI